MVVHKLLWGSAGHCGGGHQFSDLKVWACGDGSPSILFDTTPTMIDNVQTNIGSAPSWMKTGPRYVSLQVVTLAQALLPSTRLYPCGIVLASTVEEEERSAEGRSPERRREGGNCTSPLIH
jgi:hypothetical protein